MNPEPMNSLEELILKLKLQYFDHLMQTVASLKKTMILRKIEGKRRRWQKMNWLNSNTNSMDMNLDKFQDIVRYREAWCATTHEVTKCST